MRRIISGLIAIGVLAAIGSTVSARAGGTAGGTLRLVQVHPLVVRGAHFHHGEQVRVTVYAKITRVKKTTTGSSGGFPTNLGNVPIGRWRGFRATAVATLGSGATLKRPPLPACLPA